MPSTRIAPSMASDGNHFNSTDPWLDMSSLTVWVLPLLCLMGTVGISANVCLIIIISRRQTLRSAPTYVTLMCLAFVDAIHLVFLIVAGVFYTYDSVKTSILCKIMILGMYCTTGVSSYHMVIFSTLRYVILVKPFFAMKYVTVKNILCSCLMCWFVFSCFAGLAFFATDLGKSKSVNNQTIMTCVTTDEGKYVSIFVLILEFYIPLTLISVFHLAKCVHMKRRSVQTASIPTQKQQVSSAVVATIIFMYVLCYFPMSIYIMLTRILETPIASAVYSLGYLFVMLTPINSSLNPFVYFFFTKCVRRKKRANVQTNSS